jgi:hypothetical protein
MTFTEYIRGRKWSDTPAGRFVRCARRLIYDGRWRWTFETWEQLEEECRADPAMVKAARVVWKGYLRAQKTEAGRLPGPHSAKSPLLHVEHNPAANDHQAEADAEKLERDRHA